MAAHRDRSGPLTAPRGTAIALEALPGLADDDLVEAVEAMRRSAGAATALRPALPRPLALDQLLRRAEGLGREPGAADARRFFATGFTPIRLTASEAFYTGYYEPVLPGSLRRTDRFTAPLLARPADLHTLAAGDARPGWAEGLSALRVGPGGKLDPYPDRAAIDAVAEDGAYRPVVWLRDSVEAFMVQVQGSARIELADGGRLRVTYAGRNGHPYTSIGRILVETGAIPADAMTLDRLKGWLRDAGLKPGQAGHAVLMRNRSFVFFDAAPDEAPGSGPIGGAGVPLTPLRSIAVDRTRWCYGLPFHVDLDLPGEGGTTEPFRRLCVAQDTGSAILGEARVDLFIGSGEAAGRRAGSIRHRGALTVLWPRDTAP